MATARARYVDCGCDCACGKGMLLLPLPPSWPSSSCPLPCLPLLYEDAVWEGLRCRSAKKAWSSSCLLSLTFVFDCGLLAPGGQ